VVSNHVGPLSDKRAGRMCGSGFRSYRLSDSTGVGDVPLRKSGPTMASEFATNQPEHISTSRRTTRISPTLGFFPGYVAAPISYFISFEVGNPIDGL
jgi:hypothetical protein